MKQNDVLMFKPFMVLLTIVIFVVVPSCSTIPVLFSHIPLVPRGKLVVRDITIDQILGPISGEFKTHSEALEIAKKTYPNAQGVIYYTGRAITSDNDAVQIAIGFYAVTFKLMEEEPPKN